MRKSTEIPAKASGFVKSEEKTVKPPFRLAVDDTKPVLHDPVKKMIWTLSLSLSLSLATVNCYPDYCCSVLDFEFETQLKYMLDHKSVELLLFFES